MIKFISLISVAFLALVFQHTAIGSDDDRLKRAGCWRYEDSPVTERFLQCFKFDLTNAEPGKLVIFESKPNSIIGCAQNSSSKWCKVYLIGHKRYTVLGVDFDLVDDEIAAPLKMMGVYLFPENMGEACAFCDDKNWVVKTDKSEMTTWGVEDEKLAALMVKMFKEGTSLDIFPAPAKKQGKDLRLDIQSLRIHFDRYELSTFTSHLHKADRFTSMKKQ